MPIIDAERKQATIPPGRAAYKAHTYLNWHSVLTIDECLQMTADWYKKFYSGSQTKDMHQFCLEQIRTYEGKNAKGEQPCSQ